MSLPLFTLRDGVFLDANLDPSAPPHPGADGSPHCLIAAWTGAAPAAFASGADLWSVVSEHVMAGATGLPAAQIVARYWRGQHD